ncbi:AI-2E family transporter [Massilia horti]|uniref:AI-2E family transporter n=1 Tax=Massilia horti TaxID=2562153 RepID=A0A4Y9SRM4_9BURK|nr:AI-2E family transporter [Massilia horti]TFW29125.1 AI-2E family transporter [Massilia horti]
MRPAQRDVLSAIFSVAIIAFAAFITQRFVLPLLWAAILATATWPLYARAKRSLGGHEIAAALGVTLLCAAVFITPLALACVQAAHQAPALAALVAQANTEGLAAPSWLHRIPLVGSAIYEWWQTTLSQPHGLSHLLTDGTAVRLHNASELLKIFGSVVMHRMIDVLFAFLSLFFFYKDGPALLSQLDAIGHHLIGDHRWKLYATKVPTAIRATVNGLVLVGLAEGVLLGISYEFTNVPSAVLWAAATGVLAIIPFGAPLAFGAVAAVLAFNGNIGGAVAVLVWGGVVLFVADHFVRPAIIGNATKLPFLAVLLGILGGVEMLGLIGLFVGPVVMTLFVTLWQEEKLYRSEQAEHMH